MGRRNVLQKLGACVIAAVTPPPPAFAESAWRPLAELAERDAATFPDAFVLYFARFLLAFDEPSRATFSAATGTLPGEWGAANPRAEARMQTQLGAFANSVGACLDEFGRDGAKGAARLFSTLEKAYGAKGQDAARRQLAVLFSLLPPAQQPVESIRAALGAGAPAAAVSASQEWRSAMARAPDALLPDGVVPRYDAATASYRLPAEFLPDSAVGAVASAPLQRERPLGLREYGLFALSGAIGCALTHLVVVPLDVVKTRMQTRPGAYAGMGDGLVSIARTEGWPMLLQGAGATGVGYFLYGATIYPGYEFWKRYFFTLAGPAAVIANRVPIVLLAGATATILTCFFITPFETVRIKMVEEPGFAPTLKAAFARVKAEGGFALFYDGLLPLMIRQVLFGMMKFLVFDTASDIILGGLPSALRASTAVALLVSLLSGAIAGVFSAIVSQPADVVLSRVAQGAKEATASGNNFLTQVGNIFSEVRAVWAEFGIGGFFLGLGSRCIWSGAIIAGQFFLYDVFKNWLHVAETDLGQFYDALSATSAFSS